MPANKFDEQIKETFDTHDFEYNPASWQQLAARLEVLPAPKKKTRFALLPMMGIAAAIALLIALPMLFLHAPAPKEAGIAAGNKAGTQQQATIPVTPSANTRPATDPQTNAETPVATTRDQQNTPVAPATQARQYQAPVKQGPVANNFRQTRPGIQQPSDPSAPIAPQDQPEKNKVPDLVAVQEPPVQQQPAVVPKAQTTRPPVTKQPSMSFNDYLPAPENPLNRSNSLSLAGGYSLGNLSSGYTLGIAARHNLGDKFYLEGNIAFVGNASQQSSNVTNQQLIEYKSQAASLNSSGGKTTSNSPPPQAAPTTTNQYYVQLSPSVHYHLTRVIAAGFGADYQRLLPQNSTNSITGTSTEVNTIRYEGDNVIKAPTNDLGIVGKIDMGVSPHIQVGLMFRDGVNNLYAKPGDSYINRQYVLLHIKYRILGK